MEKIKKLLLSQTIKDTLVSFIGLSFTAAVGFVYTVILARILGPEQFGVFSAVIALVAIVYSIGDFGIASALINFIPKLKDKRAELLNSSFWFELLISLVTVILFVLFALFHQIIIPGSHENQLLVAGLLAVNYIFINYIQGIFTAERKFLRYSVSQIIDAGVKITIVLVLLAASRLSIETALIANVISTLLALAFTFGKEFVRIKVKRDKEIFSKIFSFAKWIAVSKVFSVFISRIDVILLNLLSGSFQAGIFAAANRITLLFTLLVSSLGSVINPRFSSFDNKEKVTTYIRKLLGLVTLITGAMLLSAAFAKPIVYLVFGDKFAQAIPVYLTQTIAMIPFIYSLVTIPALIYTFNEPKFVARITAIQVITMIILELLLIPSLGAYAPSIAIGSTNLIVLILSGVRLRKHLGEV